MSPAADDDASLVALVVVSVSLLVVAASALIVWRVMRTAKLMDLYRRWWNAPLYVLARRWAAFVLNFALFGAIASVIAIVLGDVPEVAFIASVLIFFGLVDLLPTATTGATVGHHAMRLRIRRTDGGRPTGRDALARTLGSAGALAGVLAIAAVPAIVLASSGYPLVSDALQVFDAASAFDAPIPTITIALLVLVAPFLLAPGRRGWHELVSGTMVVPLAALAADAPAPRVPRRALVTLAGVVALAIALAALPAVAVAGRAATLETCRAAGEGGGVGPGGFAISGPTGRSSLDVRRPPPPGVIADPWWVFAPHEKSTVSFADGSSGTRIVSTPGPGSATTGTDRWIETSFEAGGVRWLLISSGSPGIPARHDELVECVQARLGGAR